MANVKKNVVHGDESKDIYGLFSMLIFFGYLTATLLSSPNLFSLSIFNEEIRQAFVSEILSFNGENVLLPLLADLRSSILLGDEERIKEVLSRYVLSTFSYFDLSCERVYQIIIATILSMLFQDAIVKSEVNEREGRCDLLSVAKEARDLRSCANSNIEKARNHEPSPSIA